MARLTLTLLGGFEARMAGASALALPTRKAEALLSYLATRPRQGQPRGKLTALLWGETSDGQARNNLRYTLSVLRQALAPIDPTALVSEGQAIALDPTGIDIDVVEFERQAMGGTPDALERAAALYRGDLLEGFVVDETAFEEWLVGERERLREVAIDALARLLAHQSTASDVEPAIRTALRLLGLDPLQEVVHRALMRLYARQGRLAAGLRQYQVCVAALRRDLGVEPEAETRRLYQELVRRRHPLLPTAGAQRPGRGLVRRGIAPGAEIPVPETPLIGREAEVRALGQALDDVAKGRGRVIVILGEAGMGKSRLVEHVIAEGESSGVRTFLGRSHESEQILPFGPWVDALRAGPLAADREVVDGLGRGWQTQIGRLVPEWGGPGPEPRAAPEDHRRVFEAVARLLAGLAARQALVVALEDLHWADTMSLRLLGFLAHRVAAVPVLLVATAREEDVASVPGLSGLVEELDREPRATRHVLSPLSPDETLSLVQALARTGRDARALAELGARVWSVSEGNPFVAVEVMRALEMASSPVETPGSPLPERIRELTAARLERLGSQARHLLDVAAVLGGEFDFALLERSAGAGEEEAAAGCEELVRRRVLRGVGEQFQFVHNRVRDVAYRQLLAPRRKLLHRAAARAMESLYETDLEARTAALAAHYCEADVPEKAVRYLALAAEVAARRSAHADVLATTELALAQAERLPLPERDQHAVAIGFRREGSLFFLGRLGESLELLRRLRDPVERLRDPAAAARHHVAVGRVSLFTGDGKTADRSSRLALDAASASGDVAIMGEAHFMLAYLAYFSCSPREGLEHGRRAIELLRGQGCESLAASSLATIVFNHFLLGELNLAIEAARDLRRLGEATEDSRPQAWSAWSSGILLAKTGDAEAGVVECQRGFELASDPMNRCMTLGNLGFAHVARNAPAEAIPLLAEAIEIADTQTRVPQHRVMMREFLSEAYLLAGDLDRAIALVHDALGIPQYEQWCRGGGLRLMLGRIAWARGDLAAAAGEFEAALRTFESIPAQFEAGRTRLFMAELDGDRRAVEAATRHAREALAAFTALELPRWIGRAERLVTQLDPPTLSATTCGRPASPSSATG